MLELEEVKVHANDEAAQKAVLREELRRKEAVSIHTHHHGFISQTGASWLHIMLALHAFPQESIQFEQTQQALSEQLKAKEQEAPHQLLGESTVSTSVCYQYLILWWCHCVH